MPTDAPRPVLDDPDTAGFFAAAARGELAIRRCSSCDAVLHLPRSFCSRCGSGTSGWHAVAPRGRVWSWTVVEHQTHPAFPTPYTLVLVSLDDAPEVRLVGHLPGTPAVYEGMPLHASFERAAGRPDTVIHWT